MVGHLRHLTHQVRALVHSHHCHLEVQLAHQPCTDGILGHQFKTRVLQSLLLADKKKPYSTLVLINPYNKIRKTRKLESIYE
jgi:hypothetical protein